MRTNTDNPEQTELKPPDRITVRVCRCGVLVAGVNACPHCGAGWAQVKTPPTEYARVSASSAAPTLCPNCGGSGEIEIGCAISHALTAPCVECGGTGIAPVGEKCEHGIPWSMECLSCGHSDYVAAASPASTQEEELVDEVQRRMDQVVEAAVEWHQVEHENAEWFDAADRLSAAIDSLLEIRSRPTQDAEQVPEP